MTVIIGFLIVLAIGGAFLVLGVCGLLDERRDTKRDGGDWA